MWQKPRNVTKFKFLTLWHLKCHKMSRSVNLRYKTTFTCYVLIRLGTALSTLWKKCYNKICSLTMGRKCHFFWFLVCYPATQLATQLRQRRIQMVRSNRVTQKRPAESNGTPAMDPGHLNIDVTSRTPWQMYLLKSLLIYSTERRKHAHTTPTHVNRQTDKECAWGRPRLLHTVLNCYFWWSSWQVTKGLLRDYFT